MRLCRAPHETSAWLTVGLIGAPAGNVAFRQIHSSIRDHYLGANPALGFEKTKKRTRVQRSGARKAG